MADSDLPFKTWMCLICGWIYDEEGGSPAEGIAPGTRWEAVPPNWTCPECGARKDDFEMMEI
jgi:rubredoxin